MEVSFSIYFLFNFHSTPTSTLEKHKAIEQVENQNYSRIASVATNHIYFNCHKDYIDNFTIHQ